MIVIKTQQEPSTRVLLRLIEAIRYKKLYEELEYLKSLEAKEKERKKRW